MRDKTTVGCHDRLDKTSRSHDTSNTTLPLCLTTKPSACFTVNFKCVPKQIVVRGRRDVQ